MDSLMSPVFRIDDSVTKPGKVENPKDGLEFVRNVIYERKDCLDTVTAQIDGSRIRSKQNIFIEELPKTETAPNHLLPTQEWQLCQEADFSEIRCRISRLFNEKEVWQCSTKIPPITREDSSSLWKIFLSKNEPVLSLVFTMKQPVLEFILDVLIEMLNEVTPGHGISNECGKWLYAVLASLKLPLVPEVCSSLRELARRCSQIRAKLSVNDVEVLTTTAPLNLFICIVARYFRQGDLAD